ncbi:MAG: class I SAM-dependent methyltransferase [Chitinivibrionia bacterium]|nr:class I SAM-dependent methyltransferase [Chitinivibrionia bacterium]
MKLFPSKNITQIINWTLDNIVPPILRDNKFFMYPLMSAAYGKQTKILLDFKEKFPFMSDEELARCYKNIVDVPVNTGRKSDLNTKCLNYILNNINKDLQMSSSKTTCFDASCGNGYLLKQIAKKYPNIKCIGGDIAPRKIDENIEVLSTDITNLQHPDKYFDIVLCTHTLEHIREPKKALLELIRVTKKRLIIAVPRQREYRYTVDLHVNFFPYMYDFKRFIGIENAKYLKLGGDFLCCIDIE